MTPFIVLSLPRSRTAWLSKFLTYDGWVCGHEEIQRMRSLKDIKMWFNQPYIGTVETAAAPWWRLINVLVPNIKIVVVRRPVLDVVESLIRACPATFDRDALLRGMTYLDRKLCQLARRLPNVLVVNFSDLEQEETCAKVFEHCLELSHDHDHWESLKDQNVQINLPAMVRYATAYRQALEKLGNQATQKMFANISLAKRKIIEPTGITIKQESFSDLIRDGQHLFEQHCIEVGEPPEQWQHKNLQLLQYLDNAGTLQVMVARSNGRIFGYLITLITPSLVTKELVSSTHSTFYASPEFPGLGLKLQRAANRRLKENGVDEIFMQTGTRGSGERLDTIYRRLGAENVGQLYRLDLKEA